jgi:hypothetical protein
MKAVTLHINDSVLVQNTEREFNGMPISHAYYHGAYKITRVLEALTYLLGITDRGTKKIQIYNRKVLRKYYELNSC